MVNGVLGVLTPAYGRDYKSKKAVEKDFRDGKDFVLNSINGGGCCSIRDFVPGQKVQIRYSKNTKVTIVKV